MGRMTYLERADRFGAAVEQARARGDADLALVDLLAVQVFDSWSKGLVLVALGDTTGPTGATALRSEYAAAVQKFSTSSAYTRAEYRDLICTCIWALGKREGSDASGIFVEAAGHANTEVRLYGLMALAAVGDDRAWDQVFAAFAEAVKRQPSPKSHRWTETQLSIEYLARHSMPGAGRSMRLTALLRDGWQKLADADRIERSWPGLGPGGLPPEEAPWLRPMREWSSANECMVTEHR